MSDKELQIAPAMRKYFCDQCSEDGEDPYHFSDDGRTCNDCNHSIDNLHVTPVVNHHLWRDQS